MPWGSKESYYSCHKKAVFPLDTVRKCRAEAIAGAMETAAKNHGDTVHRYSDIEPDALADDMSSQRTDDLISMVRTLEARLGVLEEVLPGVRITSEKRYRDIAVGIQRTGDSLRILEEKIGLLL